MALNIDPMQELELKALAQEAGISVGDLLHALVGEALESSARKAEAVDTESALLARQREALKGLHARLDVMPLVRHADGLSGSRDHDAILHGKRS
jgi:hypothetical protein